MPIEEPEEPEIVDPDEISSEYAKLHFWSRKQTADYLGISIDTVRRKEKSGDLNPRSDENGQVWFEPEEVKEFAAARGGVSGPPPSPPGADERALRTTEMQTRRDLDNGMVETRRRITEPLPQVDPSQNIARVAESLMQHLQVKDNSLQDMLNLSLNTLVETNKQLRGEVLTKDKMIEDLVKDKFNNLELFESMLSKKHERDLETAKETAKEKRKDQSLEAVVTIGRALAPALMLQFQGDKEGAKRAADVAAQTLAGGGGDVGAHGHNNGSANGSSGQHGTAKVSLEDAGDAAAVDMLLDNTTAEELSLIMGFLKPIQQAAIGQLAINYNKRKEARASSKAAASDEAKA